MRNLKSQMLKLIRRVIEIDYRHKHRHAPTSLSALPIIVEIYDQMDPLHDVFILSKGHSCAALYAVLEEHGLHPDITKVHPERDPANGIEITSGSLGHGLPIAVGIALAKQLKGEPGIVYVLMGDGECQEGTTWEAANLAKRLLVDNLRVHVDGNGYQGADSLLSYTYDQLSRLMWMSWHSHNPGQGVPFFESRPGETVHAITDAEFAEIMEELK